jgi:hypothetical protein
MSMERKIITSLQDTWDGKVKEGRDADSPRARFVRQTGPQPLSTAGVSPDFESHTVLNSPQEKKSMPAKSFSGDLKSQRQCVE